MVRNTAAAVGEEADHRPQFSQISGDSGFGGGRMPAGNLPRGHHQMIAFRAFTFPAERRTQQACENK